MIYKKLLDFQKLGISIKKNKINPHFKNEYADLNEILEKVKPPLNALGIAIIPKASREGVTTVLHDTEDDTTEECFIPFINPTDMQKLGGAITYARRYGLTSLLCLEDEDDDGNTASVKAVVPKAINVQEEEDVLDF